MKHTFELVTGRAMSCHERRRYSLEAVEGDEHDFLGALLYQAFRLPTQLTPPSRKITH